MDIERITQIAQANRYFSSMQSQRFDELLKLREATIGFPIGLRAIVPVGNRIVRWQWAVARPTPVNSWVREDLPNNLIKRWTGSQMTGNDIADIYGKKYEVRFFGVLACRVQVVFCNESRFTELRFATHVLQEKFRLAVGRDEEVEAAREACNRFYLK